MRDPTHTPVFLLNGQAMAKAGIPWMPIGFIVGRIVIPPAAQLLPANDNSAT